MHQTNWKLKANMKYWFSVVVFFVIIFSSSTSAGEDYKSKYVGQEHRKIRSLSPDDIDELKKGGGWGLAKAAELNGVPGPAHILEMKDEIHLTDEQKIEIQKIYNDMKVEAVNLGEQLIRLEMELNNNFANRTINQPILEKFVQEIEKVRANLRLVHLSTHLQTPNILTNEQIILYNKLRGYSKDPCQNTPEGHNAEMWKKHNGCK
jgi:Spy/CpxP family protein refolding chaperone